MEESECRCGSSSVSVNIPLPSEPEVADRLGRPVMKMKTQLKLCGKKTRHPHLLHHHHRRCSIRSH